MIGLVFIAEFVLIGSDTSCLRLQRNMIRFPPHTPLDEGIANERMFCPHNEDEIKAFESRQFQRLVEYSKEYPFTFRIQTKTPSINKNTTITYEMNRPKDSPLHVLLPEDAGRITKSSQHICMVQLYVRY